MSQLSARPKDGPDTKVLSQSQSRKWHYPFWFGGSASSMATMVTHPLDLVKVRLQTRSPTDPKTMLSTFMHIFRNQGPVGLYSGLSAALLRQLTYSTVRFGVYEDLKTRFQPAPTPTDPRPRTPLPQLLLMSSAAGFLGGLVGNPGDVINVRMQADQTLPPAQRRNYRHALDGLIRMTREEGAMSLTRGIFPNAARALLMTTSQLASYDTFKTLLTGRLGRADDLVTHLVASLAAGFVATTICSPVDVVKTRIMSSASETVGIRQLLSETTRKEGWKWIFRGWVPSFMRLGPQTIATMVFFEQHKKLYRSLKGESEKL